MMYSLGINGEGELRRQPAKPGSSEKMTVKTVCVCLHTQIKICASTASHCQK